MFSSVEINLLLGIVHEWFTDTFIIIGQYIVRINYYIYHQSFYLNRDSLFLVSMISCLLGRCSGVIMLFRFLIRGVALVPDAANCSAA